jgi:hypothetical protein
LNGIYAKGILKEPIIINLVLPNPKMGALRRKLILGIKYHLHLLYKTSVIGHILPNFTGIDAYQRVQEVM